MKYKKQQEQKVEAFKKQRSAKVIQKSWRGHKEQKEEVEEACMASIVTWIMAFAEECF